MAVTLKDIADELGISISTVSRALSANNASKVKPATLLQIQNTMKKLGYVPDPEVAPFLIDDNSIGIVLASSGKSFSHLLFAEMLDCLQEEIFKTTYSIKYIVAESKLQKEKLYEIVEKNPVSGIIVLGPADDTLLTGLKTYNTNLIYAGVNHLNFDIDQVICSGFDIVSTIFEHFYSLGYRKIAYLGPHASLSDAQVLHERFESYQTCLQHKGLQLNWQYTQSTIDTVEDGYTAMYKLLSCQDHPEAIICTGDSIAVGALRAAKENGITVPDQIAIAGMDNVKIAQYLIPSLTTIDIPKSELCNLALTVLIDKIEGKRVDKADLRIPFDLVMRESCGYKKSFRR